MAQTMSMVRLLGFNDFFPNDAPKDKEFYAKYLGKDLIQKYCCFFLGYFRNRTIPPVEQLIAEWFTYYNHRYYQSPAYYAIEQEYRRIKTQHPGEKHALISVESLLDTFIWTLTANIPEDVDLDASSSIRFFDLILAFNSDVLHRYAKVTESIKGMDDSRRIQRQIFAGSFSQSDLINVDYAQVYFCQIYKLAELLNFLATNKKYTPFLDLLLKEFDCANPGEFLKAVAAAVTLPLQGREPGWSVLRIRDDDESRAKSFRILENLSLSLNDEIQPDQDDYKPLRNRPFQRINEKEFRVIFDLFLIKKLYNGIIFKLSSYDRDFLGNIRGDFSEGVLVYDTLNNILSAENSVKITGNQFKDQGLEVEPDYYYRKKEEIVLFESKDFFMKGESKLSYDFNVIENELKTNGRSDKPDRLMKAVHQLSKNIQRCIDRTLPIDHVYDPQNIVIFPVIIVHDSLYSAPGLNFWINYWLQDELEKLKTDAKYKDFDFARVAPLTIIEIDTLILYQEQFKNGTFDLVDMIRHFQNYVLYRSVGCIPPEFIEAHAKQSALSFSEYVREVAHRNKIEIDFKQITRLLNKYGID
jgi:hypothetical protein